MCAKEGLTYSQAGVDIEKGNEAVELIKPFVKSTFRPEVVTDLGGFGGLFALNTDKYQEPILVSGTDGVGTKLKLAFQMGKHDTIGIDAVAMCVNDILVSGAEPLFFLDYLAVGKLDPQLVVEIVKGVAEGCRQGGCSLIGGETAEMPGFYQEGEYDIAGFAVGVVDRPKIIDGSTIKAGDIVLGIPSSGLHSNGFSLARKVLLEQEKFDLDAKLPELGAPVGEVLIEPTRIYVSLIRKILEKHRIKGMAHITGGGLLENIPRILPENCQCLINQDSWPSTPIFQLIQNRGQIETQEMFKTFNMGIGMILIVDREEAQLVMDYGQDNNEKIYRIGSITEGEKKVVLQKGSRT